MPIPSAVRHRFAMLALLAGLWSALLPAANSRPLDFSLPSLDTQPIQLSAFRGRWVVVNFWASWCPPCLLEMPELQAFYETQSNRATVIGVNYQDLAADEIRFFAQRLAISFPIALSGGKAVAGFKLKALPTTFLISPTGQLAETYLGAVNANLLIERIAALEKTSRSTR